MSSAPKLRGAIKHKSPGIVRERDLWANGQDIVVGIDEVGKGAWAGPLTLAAVVVPKHRRVYKIRDSKMLTEPEREAMFERIADWCEAWSVGHATHRECDELGMSEAQRLAARRALDGLGVEPDHVLIDGKWDFIGNGRTTNIIKGDATCLSIASASILAKVTRDRLMRDAARHYPAYVFDQNKGYPCPRHKAALQKSGPSPIHRRSWVFMDNLPFTAIERYHRPDPQLELFQGIG
jgi:ribonuclease HII